MSHVDPAASAAARPSALSAERTRVVPPWVTSACAAATYSAPGHPEPPGAVPEDPVDAPPHPGGVRPALTSAFTDRALGHRDRRFFFREYWGRSDGPVLPLMSTLRNTLPSLEPLLTPKEAAAILRIHFKTVNRGAAKGLVPGIKLGKHWRYRASDLHRWLEDEVNSNRQPGE